MSKPVTLKRRVHGLYRAMILRFGPKYWKSGKRQGQLREPGQDLPFTETELMEWLSGIFAAPNEVRNCCYCRTPIDAFSASLDHLDPVTRGGSLELRNLHVIDANCNRLKGGLKHGEFEELMFHILTMAPAAQQDILGRLKSGAMGMRLRYYR